MTTLKLTQKLLDQEAAKWAGKPAFEKSTNRKAFATWALFYRYAKDQGLDPLDRAEELLIAAKSFRSANKIKPSPRTQRTVMKAVFGEDRLPKVRSPGAKKGPDPDDAEGVLKVAIKNYRSAIKRCEQGIETLSLDLAKYRSQLAKLEKALSS